MRPVEHHRHDAVAAVDRDDFDRDPTPSLRRTVAHPRLSINAMCTFGWSFDQDLALWADLGCRHAGLLITKLAGDPDERMRRLGAAGIRASMLTVGGFLADPSSWEKTQAAHREAIDCLADHCGHSIYFTAGRTTTRPWGEDLERFAEAMAPTVVWAIVPPLAAVGRN